MKTLFISIICCFVLFDVSAQGKFVLDGDVEGFADSTWLMLQNADRETIVDSTQIVNKKFRFEGTVNGYEQFVISTKFNDSPESFQYKFMWIEPGKIHLNGKSGEFKSAVVKGSAVQLQAEEATALTIHIEQQLDSLNDEYRKGTFSDNALLAEARAFRNKLQQEELDINIKFIREHPKYLYSAYLLTFVKNKLEKDKLAELFASLDPSVKTSEHGKAIKNYIALKREFNEGDRYADITLPDVNGKKVSLSSLKGKYVLLDFWASGCGPCRMEHPKLAELYNQYKDEGFEIFAVSLDKNKENWLRAIEKDKIVWSTVCDLQGFNSEVALTYGVYYVPNNYLIDPDGIIIGKDVRGEALEDKIKSLFDKD